MIIKIVILIPAPPTCPQSSHVSRARNLPLLRAGRVGRAGRESFAVGLAAFSYFAFKSEGRRSESFSNPPCPVVAVARTPGPEGQALVAVTQNCASKTNRPNRQWIDISSIEYYPPAKRSPCRVEELACGGHSLPHLVRRSCPP